MRCMRALLVVAIALALPAVVAACTRPPMPGADGRAARDAGSPRPSRLEAPGAPPAATGQTASSQDDAASQEPKAIALDAAPPVTLRLVGSGLIEVSLGTPAKGADTWSAVEVERRADRGNAAEGEVFLRAKPSQRAGAASPDQWRAVHTAKPGATYRYRARAAGGAWSEEVAVHVPRPSSAPAQPSELAARAQSPYAVRLTWSASTEGTAGFEVQVGQGDSFVRAGLVGPTEREFVHHLRIPGQLVKYRIRAFNSAGASDVTDVVALTMPERPDARTGSLGAPGVCMRAPPQAPPNAAGCDPAVEELDAGQGRILYNAPTPGDGCRRRLIGSYKGCLRELGAFVAQADVVVVPGWSDDGWPLLHAVAGAGQYVGATVQTLRFDRGHYSIVDAAQFCGDRAPDVDDLHTGAQDADLTKCFPPFDACQTDYAL